MLDALRRSAQSWVMKAILVVIALTFVVFFGSTDFGGGGGADAVIEVGDVSFSVQEVGREFNDQVRDLSMRVGNRIDAQRAIQAGLLDETISQMVTHALFDQAAEDLGVMATQDAAAAAIRALPRFHNAEGRFDRQLFETFLRSAGMSEGGFVQQAQRDLLRAQYLGTLNEAIALPDPLAEALYARRGEHRVAELAIVPVDSQAQVADPGEAQLATWFEENKARFRFPEFRRVTLASLTPERLAEEIDVPDEELAKAYQARINEFRTPAMRSVTQANFASREAAERAQALVGKGKSFAEAVEEVSGQPPVELGQVSRAGLFVPALAEAVFSTPVGSIGGPVESPLGWHLVQVTGETPEQTKPLEEVRNELRRDLALERSHDRMFEVLNTVEDALAGGATLEEAARASGLAVDAIEAAPPGAMGVEAPALTGPVLQAVFEAEPGDVAEVIETDNGGFVVVRVEESMAAREPSLEEVRPRVVEAWKQAQRRQAAVDTAKELAGKVRAGGDLETLAKEAGARFSRTEPFDRIGQTGDVPRPLIAPLFAAKEGEIVEVPADDGAAVAQLVEIRPADMGAPAYDQYRQQLRLQMSDDLLTQLATALQRDHPVQVRRDLIEQSLVP